MVVWVLIVIGVVLTPLVEAVALYRGGLTAGLSPRRSATVAVSVGLVWLAWVGVSAALAANGVYGPNSAVPWLGVAALGAMVVALSAGRIPVVRRILAAPGGTARLAWPHMVRVLGILFLIALALARRWTRTRAIWFNVFGLLDLVVAVTLGLLGGLAAHPVLVLHPSTLAMTLLPLALIPTAVVPLDAALHVISLARLRGAARPVVAPVPVVSP
ncbi:MAG TPA: hypothetical protein VG247_15090 [Pseudonocardiaceae bacterium]|nr:hypothetical protein [Pseudonocardiaceae bacterium]